MKELTIKGGKIAIEIKGAGWVTAGGVGQSGRADSFSLAPGPLPKLDKALLSFNPESRWGRLDEFCRLGLIAADQAMVDAQLAGTELPDTAALLIATRTGSLDTDGHYIASYLPEQGLLASPNLFAYTLPGCMLGEISIRYGFRGPAMVVDGGNGPLGGGLEAALRYLYFGLTPLALAGFCNYTAGRYPPGATPGAVMVALALGDGPGPLIFDGQTLFHRGEPVTDLNRLMECSTRLRQKRLVQ